MTAEWAAKDHNNNNNNNNRQLDRGRVLGYN